MPTSTADELPFRLDSLGVIDWSSRLRAEMPFLLDVLAGAPSKKILDLGCGEGQHARELAEAGFQVVGIDASEERLERARERDTEGSTELGNEFVLGEIGAVEAGVRGQFGAALCLGDTLAEQIGTETVARMMIGLRRRLLPGAPVVVQLRNFERLRTQRSLPVQVTAAVDGVSHVCLRLLETRPDGVVVLTASALTHRPQEDPPLSLLGHRVSFLQAWGREEVETFFEVARFRRWEVWGGVDGSPFHPTESEHLIVVAR